MTAIPGTLAGPVAVRGCVNIGAGTVASGEQAQSVQEGQVASGSP